MKKILMTLLCLSISVSYADFFTGQKNYKEGNFETAYLEFNNLAKLGNIRAQYNIALMLFNGEGVERNNIAAYAWAKTAGSSKSSTEKLTNKISKKLSNKELFKAIDLSKKLIAQYGVIETKTLLGPIEVDSKTNLNEYHGSKNSSYIAPNFNHIVRNKKSQSKLEYPRKATKKSHRGWVDLNYNIYPDGTVRNISISHQYPHELFSPSAIEYIQNQTFNFYMNEKKVTPNQVIISSNRSKFGVYGWSGLVGKKTTKKVNDLYHSAIKGNIKSQYEYSNLFYTILNKNGLASEKTINNWLFRTSRYGIPKAQYMLGRNIYFGKSCLNEPQKGLDWIIRSAQGGNIKAQYLAYQILKRGNLINTSNKSAQQWLDEAASNGSFISQFILAKQIVANTDSTDIDNNLAIQYLDNYAIHVGKTIDWYQTYAILLSNLKQYNKAEKFIKTAIKMANTAHWDLSELSQQKKSIQQHKG